MSTNHPQFQKALRDSEPAVWQMARWLVGKGYAVAMPPTKIAPAADQWQQYADNGDIYLLRARMEVKKYDIDFTSAKDWPYPDFFVVGRDAFDRAEPKPYAFYIVNRAFTHVALVLTHTAPFWTVVRHGDKRYGADYRQDTYCAPLDMVTFLELEQQS